MSNLIPQRYLGDSVYADVEYGMVKLTTENGAAPSNTIYLAPGVMDALAQFYEDAQATTQRLRRKADLETPEP